MHQSSVPLSPSHTDSYRRAHILFQCAPFFVIALCACLILPRTARAADGSGTNVVAPTAVIASSTGNTLNFTFTPAETMNSGGFTIAVPSGWSSPTNTAGIAGYTTAASGVAIIADLLDALDSTSTWSAGTACTNGLSATTTVRVEGTASLACRNGNESTGDSFYKNITSQDWSGYTTVGFWIRPTVAVNANRLRFSYDNNANLASPIAQLNLPALPANAWTYVTLTLTGVRTSIASFGFNYNHGGNFDNMTLYVDDLLIGPGVPTFPGGNVINLSILRALIGQTITVSYGSGGGTNGATAPPTGRLSTFVTQSSISVTGTLTTIASSPVVTVNNPVPTLVSISPNLKTVGDGTFVLTVSGTNFNASSTASFGSSPLTTSYVSSTELSASVPGSFLTASGTFSITVNNPTPGGGTSTAQTLTINNPVPTLTSVVPNTATAGDGDTVITLTGTDFVSGSIARFNGSNLSTTFNSSTQLTATIASSSLRTSGVNSVTVFNPTLGGGTSNAQTFTTNNAVPTIDALSPSTVQVGGTDFELHISGSGFATSSIVSIDGNPLTTAYFSDTHIHADVSASYIATTGTRNITVFNPSPGGGTSTPSVLTVSDTAPPVITITAPTKTSNTAITNTTIHVTNDSIQAVNVLVDPSTTAGTSGFICSQTSPNTVVDCTITITSSGNLVIKATDDSANSNTVHESRYVIDAVAPTITITAPTTASSTAITNTTIHVVDAPSTNAGVLAANVIVDPSTTAGTSGFSCSQTATSTVDCIVTITSSGTLVIKATDNATNTSMTSQSGYVIDATLPVITITAPTKLSNGQITDTTIHVTDGGAILTTGISIDPTTTAGVSGLSCTQTNSTTVDCTIEVLSSGTLVIKAADVSSNTSTQSETGYVIDATAAVIAITAPTKLSTTTITNTTIHVTDNNAVTASNVIVDPSTTAGTSGFNCTQTNAATVDCTINITAGGNLVIKATDNATNVSQQAENDYGIDVSLPVIGIDAPTKTSSSTISNTTIHVTDAFAVTAANVLVDPSTTAGTSGFSCTQTNVATVDCIINITASGNLVITASDDIGNSSTGTVTGYVIETVLPVITITAPTKVSDSDIRDTAIHVTDNNGILYTNVSIGATSTAAAHNFSCSQTNGTTVDCAIEIDSSGALAIRATDNAGNTGFKTESGYTVTHAGPTIAITAPTKISNTTITDTTVHVTDDIGLLAADVLVAATTTAGTSGFSCAQTSSTAVDCTINITSSGRLVITAMNSTSNTTWDVEGGYVIETTAPTVVITAPTKVSQTHITDTTIHATDSSGILAADVVVDLASTVDTSNFSCTQTNGTTVDCTLEIHSAGDLVITATDIASNTTTATETGYAVHTIPPNFSSISAVPTNDSATITWTTDEPASSKVVYGLDTTYALTAAESDTTPRVTSHSVLLSGLTVCTLYHYKVVSVDFALNPATSTDQTFTTTGCTTPSTSGGSGTPAAGYLPPSGAFSIMLQGGGSFAQQNPVILILSASPDVDRMSISRFADFHDAGVIPFAPTVNWLLCGAETCPAGTYDVYAKVYQAYGIASPVEHLIISFAPTGASTQAPTVPPPSSIPFREGLSDAQKASITLLLTKPLASWTAADKANWNYATNNAPFPGQESETVRLPLFARNLRLGSSGEDVKRLQIFLNTRGFILAQTGPGSSGQETNYFGALTVRALIRFQEAYATDILKPLNLAKGTGYFGASTRKYVNSLLEKGL